MLKSFTRLFTAAPLTFRDLYPKFYASREAGGLRPWTLSRHRNFGKHLVAKLGDRIVDDMRRDDYRAMEAETSAHFMEGVRCVVRWAHAEGLIAANSMPPRRPEPRSDQMSPTFLTPSEAQRIYAAMEDRFKPMLALAMFAGLRPMEACRMDWSAIHVAERRLRIEPAMTKVRRARVIEGVPTIVWAQLALFEQRSGPLCPGETDFSKYEHWSEAKQRAAIKSHVKLKPNVFRHSFATYFTALTGNPALTARVLGHTKLDLLTRHYDGLATKVQAEHYFHPKPILALPAPPIDSPGHAGSTS